MHRAQLLSNLAFSYRTRWIWWRYMLQATTRGDTGGKTDDVCFGDPKSNAFQDTLFWHVCFECSPIRLRSGGERPDAWTPDIYLNTMRRQRSFSRILFPFPISYRHRCIRCTCVETQNKFFPRAKNQQRGWCAHNGRTGAFFSEGGDVTLLFICNLALSRCLLRVRNVSSLGLSKFPRRFFLLLTSSSFRFAGRRRRHRSENNWLMSASLFCVRVHSSWKRAFPKSVESIDPPSLQFKKDCFRCQPPRFAYIIIYFPPSALTAASVLDPREADFGEPWAVLECPRNTGVT